MSTKLEPGRYRARILYHTMTVNSNDNPELRITALPYNGDPAYPLPPNYSPSPITIYMTITPATIGSAETPGWVLATLKHLGFQSQALEDLDPTSDTAHSFTGREITITGSEDNYKNKKRVRWNIMRQENEAQPIGQTKLAQLSTRYKDALQILRPKEDQQAPKPPF